MPKNNKKKQSTSKKNVEKKDLNQKEQIQEETPVEDASNNDVKGTKKVSKEKKKDKKSKVKDKSTKKSWFKDFKAELKKVTWPKGKELFSIQGTPPSLYNVIKGDAFAERNPFCLAVDLQYDAPYFYVSDTHFAKTWLLDPRAPKIEKPEIIQNIHEKLEKTLTQFSKEEYEYVRYNKQRSHLVDTEYRHRLSKR